jgi:hypothetical protein
MADELLDKIPDWLNRANTWRTSFGAPRVMASFSDGRRLANIL